MRNDTKTATSKRSNSGWWQPQGAMLHTNHRENMKGPIAQVMKQISAAFINKFKELYPDQEKDARDKTKKALPNNQYANGQKRPQSQGKIIK